MSSTKNLKIDQWILDNPKKPEEIGYYKKISELFGIHPENARKRWRDLQKKEGIASNCVNYYSTVERDNVNYVITSTGGETQVYTFKSEESIENLEDLIRIGKIDTEKFDIIGYDIKSYNAWIKNKEGQIEKKALFSVKATLKTKKLDTDVKLQKDLLLEEIKKDSQNERKIYYKQVKNFAAWDGDGVVERDSALEINIPDLHIGKLAWGKETGEDYDIKIAIARYKKAVEELVSRVNPLTLEKFILPVGNDMINVDNAGNTTTAGTNVSCDSRFGKMFQAAKNLLIETIDSLTVIAPVEVVVIPGNHDSVSMFTLGEVLDAWYHENDKVTVINTHTPRKYIQYGQNMIMYTHGHREKLNDLGIICATEQPHLWAATKFRRVHVGHFHHSKQIKFVDVQEFPGFTVKILNSLSANDAWHAEKGYNSLKGAEAFLYHKDKGLLANYYYLNQ